MASSRRKDEPGSAESVYGRGLGIRHLQVAAMSMAGFINVSLVTNLSVTIVAMADRSNNNATNPIATNPIAINFTAIKSTDISSTIPTFDWDEKVQGYVLSSFFWGYLFTQLPAGVLSSRYGGHRFLCGAILISSALNFALPKCAISGGWPYLCALRMLQGLIQGFVFPSIFTLLGVWVPPDERSVLASVTISGLLLGIVVSLSATGFLISVYGWPSVFYVVGAVGMGGSTLMFFLGADSPSKHRLISNSERTYIQTSLGGAKVKRRVPWKKVILSAPYLATVCVMTTHGVVFSTLLAKIPTYLGTVLKFSIRDNGLVTALPFLVSWLLTFVCSWLGNLLISRRVLKVTTTRKLFNSIAHFGGAVFMVLLSHAEDSVMAVICLVLTVSLQSGIYVGAQSTFVDLAPNFSGAIFSLYNCINQAISSCGPNIVGFIVTENGSAAQWRIVFYLGAFLWVLGNAVYLIWGVSETQYWNWPDRYNSKLEYEKSKVGGELREEIAPVRRRYSIHGAELME